MLLIAFFNEPQEPLSCCLVEENISRKQNGEKNLPFSLRWSFSPHFFRFLSYCFFSISSCLVWTSTISSPGSKKTLVVSCSESIRCLIWNFSPIHVCTTYGVFSSIQANLFSSKKKCCFCFIRKEDRRQNKRKYL